MGCSKEKRGDNSAGQEDGKGNKKTDTKVGLELALKTAGVALVMEI